MRWRQSFEATPLYQRRCTYWRDRLAEAFLPLTLPALPGRRVSVYRGVRHEPVPLTVELRCGLAERARLSRVTFPLLVHAAFAESLAQWLGRTRILLPALAAGRPLPQMDAIAGCFISLQPLCIDLSGQPLCEEILHRTRRAYVDAVEQDVLGWLDEPLLMGGEVLTNIVTSPPVPATRSIGHWPASQPLEFESRAFPWWKLCLCWTPHAGLSFQYDESGVDDLTVQMLARDVVMRLREYACRPQAKVTDA